MPFVLERSVPPSLRERLVHKLAGRTRLPRGEAARIAREFDCTRERIRQLLGQLEVSIEPPKRAHCDRCGKILGVNKTGRCLACILDSQRVTLTCVRCGKTFQRRRKWHNEFLNRVVKTRYGPICSKGCLLRVERQCSWCGKPAVRRRPSDNSSQAFCGPPRSCAFEAQRVLSNTHWNRLTPELLPMVEHRDEIARLWPKFPQTRCSWCGRPAGRRASPTATLPFCLAPPRPCLTQAMQTLPTTEWHRLTPDLFPMAEHRAEIAKLDPRLNRVTMN